MCARTPYSCPAPTLSNPPSPPSDAAYRCVQYTGGRCTSSISPAILLLQRRSLVAVSFRSCMRCLRFRCIQEDRDRGGGGRRKGAGQRCDRIDCGEESIEHL